MKWREVCTEIGVPNLHLHDLRHTGNTFAAQSGASLRDLMTRMGHDSPAAALIYQHSSQIADRAIAEALDVRLTAHRRATLLRPSERPKSPKPVSSSGPVEGPKPAMKINFGDEKEGEIALTRSDDVERTTRIELAFSAWEADVLPLNYIRVRRN